MSRQKDEVRSRKRSNITAASTVSLIAGELAKTPISPDHQLHVEYVSIGALREPARKLRRFSKRHLAALKASLEEFGLLRPLLIDKDSTIIGGVAVWMAAKELKYEAVPVIRIEHLSPEQIRLYRIADNKLQMGEFDNDELRLEFLELSDLSIELDLNLDIEVTGFTTKETDDITLRRPPANGHGEASADDDEDYEDLKPGSPITLAGDIWLIGSHKIICGNSLDRATFSALMGDELAQMVVCDSPYNCPIKGHVSGRKDAKEFAYASGEMASEEFIAFLRNVFGHLVHYSVDGSIHYAFMDWRCLFELLAAGRAEYDEHKNTLIWVKTNASRGFYRSQWEACAVFKRGTAPHICTFGIEKGARWRSNVIMQAGCNSFGATRDEDLADHPTVKPLSLIADLMRDCSRRGGIIVDPFGGSGTTLLAAEWTGRRARLIEIDPGYVDVTIRRAAKRFGLGAVLAATGQTFEEVAAERLGVACELGNAEEGDD